MTDQESKIMESSLNKIRELEYEIENLEDDCREMRDEKEDLKASQKEENTIEFPYLNLNDQLKCDVLLEHWDKIKLSNVDDLVRNLK
jgi:predicted RNase H-like nuclease (RuvC/YqgF family)